MPVVVQDTKTKDVLIVAYVNQQALEATLETGMATFWSTSRNELWIKGKSSGDVLKIKDGKTYILDCAGGWSRVRRREAITK